MSPPRALSARSVVEPLSRDYPLVVIVGPTASGKSALAVALAERLGGEVVNYDSVQVYRGFDIGTDKLLPDERRSIPHHLLDIVEPGELFTAGNYRKAALEALDSIRRRAKIPILVGGTGLYLRSLLDGLFDGPPRSEQLRARLAARAGRQTGRDSYLHRVLARLDPTSAARIHPRDTHKIIRAVEVCLLARQPMSAMMGRGREALCGFRAVKIGLNPERVELRRRIDRRVEAMFRTGLMSEARAFLVRPEAHSIKVLGALGYRQACLALQGKISQLEAIRQTQAATRQYAKRQMTWFRRETNVTWFAGFGDEAETQARIRGWLGEHGLQIPPRCSGAQGRSARPETPGAMRNNQ